MTEIIVAGAGHGGLTAAIKLAQAGFKVTVFEKSAREGLGLPQKDVFEKNTFEFAGLPLPKEISYAKNSLTFIPLEAETPKISLPPPAEDSIIMERRALISHLITQAEKTGVKIIFECPVTAPILLGSRVSGVRTVAGDYYADLVIDSCGIDSPLRSALPDYMRVNRPLLKYDAVFTYRAYFEKEPLAPPPETTYNLIVKEDGTTGFSWVVTEEDAVDVLICRFSPLDNEQVLAELRKIYSENPHISKSFIRGGIFCKIPVCNPLAVLVADGYAAVGDSAFMTFAVKGSGITYAMKAGAILADAVTKDENRCFTAETLWEYNRAFFKEIGFTAGRITLLRNLLNYMTAQEVNDIFKAGIFTTEDFRMISAERIDMLFGAQGRAFIKEKMKLVRENAVLKEKLSNLILWMGRLVVTETYFPNRFDRKDIEKWEEKYNNLFNDIRKKD